MHRPVSVSVELELFPARTPTLPPATHTNSYALGSRDLLLVEPATPYADERNEWLKWAQGLIAQGRRLVAILLTHHHADHTLGAEFFSKELGAPLWAHEETATRLPALRVDRHLAEGETIVLDGPRPQMWQILHTPGHAPGHVCLFEPHARQLIVGDMVASRGTILVDPHDGDMKTYLEQLDRLRSLGAATVLPAHGDPVSEPYALFSFYIKHREMREDKIVAALSAAGNHGATVEELLPSAYDDTPRQIWGLASLSLRAHLIKLLKEGRARTDGERYAGTD